MLFRKNSYLWVVGLFLCLLSLMPEFSQAHGMSEADKQAIIGGGNLRYMWLGATHMLSGYDHLAFVFGIIFFLTSFRDITKYVTAFTLGHSVTLIYATFNAIQLNYFLIDAVIGLSVSYIAFANIDGFRKYLGINPPNMILMILGLGLIHGFGLSTRLQELPLSEDNLLLNIISFNAGIELGQVSALTLMLLFIAAWRKRESFKPFSLFANYALIITGALLFLMQMHGYLHTSNPDEFILAEKTYDITSTASPALSAKTINPVTISTDSIVIVIPARGDKEYKFNISKDGSFQYSWETDGTSLFFDFHGEPAGDATGYFKSFKKGTSKESRGELTALFDGTHGWYWKNSSSQVVTITLQVSGEYLRLDNDKQTKDVLPEKPSLFKNHPNIDSL